MANTKITSDNLDTLTTLTVDDITLNGSTISGTGDITLDAVGDIILDADGDDIKIAEGGTVVMEIKHESSSIDFSLNTGDEDFKFKGIDGGATIVALQLDMSDGGTANFNNKVRVGNTSGSGILNVDNGATDGGYVHFANNVGSTTLTNDKGLAFGWNKSNGGGESVIIANQGAGSAGGLVFATNTSAGSYAERLRILANGRIGIDKSDPDGQLHVRGTTNKTVKLDPTFSSGTHTSLAFARNGTDLWRVFQNSSDDYLSFYNDGNTSYDLSLTDNGKIFVNINPAYFSSYATLGHFLIQQTGSNLGLGVIDSGASNTFKFINNGTEAKISHNGNVPIIFESGTTPGSHLVIDSGGNIGMGGETDPQHKLAVELNSGEIAMFGGQGTNNAGAYCGIGLGQVLNNNTTYQKVSIFAEGTGSGYYRQNFHIAVDTAQDSGSAVIADSKLKIDGSSGVCTIGSTSGISDYYVLRVQTTNGYGRQGSHNGTYYHHETDRSYFYWNEAGYFLGGAHSYSDENLKKDITLIPNALDSVAKMNGVTFKWKDPEKRGGKATGEGKQFGVIAQNMLEVDSELPTLSVDPLAEAGNEESDDKIYSMNYDRLSPYFIEAIKELKTKLEAAEARITELENG